jgi:arsenate reductase
MAAGWASRLGQDRIDVFSGGFDPASEVNPVVVAAMREVDIDIAAQVPKRWTEEAIKNADVVVTMGCGDSCPIFPGKLYEDWDVPNPSGHELADMRVIRDEIEERVRELLNRLERTP